MYLTDKEVADLLRVSRRTLQEYRNERLLPYIILGGKALYPESGLREVAGSELSETFQITSEKARTDNRMMAVRSCLRLFVLSKASFGYRHKQHIGILLLFGVRFP